VTRALIAIGTNSTRLLVLDGLRRLAAESRGTRIGEGLGADGTLAPEARARTLAAIGDYVGIARERGARSIDVVATSALRRAGDAEAFGAEVGKRTGIAPRILSGAEEASFSFLGATAARGGDREVAVLDCRRREHRPCDRYAGTRARLRVGATNRLVRDWCGALVGALSRIARGRPAR